MNRPYIVGLTGQSGAGKSTVSSEFISNGFHVINCDRMTHILLQPDTDCCNALKEKYPQFFDGNDFNRKKAASLLFSDKKLLESYNSTIFPFITDEIERQIDAAFASGAEFIMLDAPTLFEAGAEKLCDVIVSCVADLEVRTERITKRDNITKEDALKRFASQHDENFFRERSDYIIENNGSIETTQKAADRIAKEIKERKNGNKEEKKRNHSS